MTDPATQNLTAVVIEDDPDIRSLLVDVFEAAGFHTVSAENGLDGVRAVEEHQPVITTLDINLPGIDGFEAARRIRKFSATFIIMLSALSEETDVVLGLGAGADEYLLKPFRPRELRARVEAFLRRPRMESAIAAATNAAAHTDVVPDVAPVSAPASTWLTHRDLRLDTVTRRLLAGTREIDLTGPEFDLLATLLESKRRVRSKADLTLVLRGEDFATSYYVGDADKREIDGHISALREKLDDPAAEPRYLEAVRGVGYRLTP